MKDGARRSEQNEIKRRAAKGHSAEQISESMRITQRCVKEFMGEKSEETVVELTDDQKLRISELNDEDNSAEDIAEEMEIELSLVEAYLAEEE